MLILSSRESGSSLYLLERQARAENSDAMLYLGQLLLRPECSEEQRQSGVMWIEKAAELDNSQALYVLGMLIMAYAAQDADVSMAVIYLKRAAAKEHADAAAFLGAYLLSTSKSLDTRDEAFFWLGQAASNGSVVAALTAEQVYAKGMHGVVQDQCAAELWYEAAFLVQYPDKRYAPQRSYACEP